MFSLWPDSPEKFKVHHPFKKCWKIFLRHACGTCSLVTKQVITCISKRLHDVNANLF